MIDPDNSEDDRLREAFRGASFPPTPHFDPLVRRQIERRRSQARWSVGIAAAALLAAGVFVWRPVPRSPDVALVHPAVGRSESSAIELVESSLLFSTPPVDTLELLAHQQAAYVAVLQEMEME
jgi:hypothetical protein